MSTNKDQALAEYIVASTKNGTVRWEPMATNAFTASLRGDHIVTIESDEGWENLYLRNVQGNVILHLSEKEYNTVRGLFELARRNAYDVDKVIDEIIGAKPEGEGVKDDDIPF